jgi:stearoyl-CoA desaturase (delta-9 desaturase)
LIDFFAWLGWATELKTVPTEMIKKRVLRTGDGSHPFSQELTQKESNNNKKDVDDVVETEHFWGFGNNLE